LRKSRKKQPIVKKSKKIIVCKLAELGSGESRTNRHHRRAKANGGASISGNISKVKVDEHYAWHYFFNGRNGIPMAPEKIAAHFQILYSMIKTFFCKEGGTIKTAEEIIDWINNVWIDPECELILNQEEPPSFFHPDNNPPQQ
jgi:hypothetical protein